MTWNDVRRALALPRPGRPAQMRMSPRPRPGDVFPLPPEIRPKEAGVLILLYPRTLSSVPERHIAETSRADESVRPGKDDLHFFLTRRTDIVELHKGQVSLPGGAQEPGESLTQTALRETCEELGICGTPIEMLGDALTPIFVPVSGFRITPFVAYTPARPQVHASSDEVVEIIETPLDLIVDEKNIVEEEWNIRGYAAIVPFFAVYGHRVWGATAMVLGEFAEMLRMVRRSGN